MAFTTLVLPIVEFEFDMIRIDLLFKSHFCVSWPITRIVLDKQLVLSHVFSQEMESLALHVDETPRLHVLQLIRLGKGQTNIVLDDENRIIQDQALELLALKINGVSVPEYILDNNSVFEYKNNKQFNSRYFGPNGVWTLNFQSPMITWVLDQKIIRESNFNLNHSHPWSYQLGPNSVESLSTDIVTAQHALSRLVLP